MVAIRCIDAPLYVIAPIVNPSRYRSRYNLYRDFERYINDAGGILYTVEAAYGDRDHEITSADNPRHIQLRTRHEVWHKENLINVAVSRLPADWQYVAWIDADVRFARPDIIPETIHQLQHYDVVQLFSHATDLSRRYEPLATQHGFVSQWIKNDCQPPKKLHEYGVWHPGYAWAMRRAAWDMLGGLIDWGIVGSGDAYMATGLIGQIDLTLDPKIQEHCPTYTQWCRSWENRAEQHIRRNIGFVEGLLLHYFHGPKRNRFYRSRPAMLWENRFDPAVHMRRDWQGMLQLDESQIRLRDQLRAYFRSRNEDGTEH